MPIRSSILLLFLLLTSPLLAQDQHSFPEFSEKPLAEVLQYLESNFELVFAYRDNNVMEESIVMRRGDYTLDSYLTQLFD